ncbi:MAG: histidine kinase N-terminal 7TM domain-containing protein [Dehalococcoidia bacterium]
MPAASLVFVLVHTGRARWVSSRLVLALALFPVVSLGLIAWNPGDVAFVDVRFETVDGLPKLLFRRGPAHYLLLLYAYGRGPLASALPPP